MFEGEIGPFSVTNTKAAERVFNSNVGESEGPNATS